MTSDDNAPILAEQIRAARALLRMEQADLAKRADVSLPTIKRFELMRGPVDGRPSTINAIRVALEKAGIEFIPQNGGGAGVRLRKRDRVRKT